MAFTARTLPRHTADTSAASCEVCRTRKKRCDRQVPRCSYCRSSGSACVYRSPLVRGPRPGWQHECLVRALEAEEALRQLLSIEKVRQEVAKRRGRSFGPRRSSSERASGDQKKIAERWKRRPLGSTWDEVLHFAQEQEQEQELPGEEETASADLDYVSTKDDRLPATLSHQRRAESLSTALPPPSKPLLHRQDTEIIEDDDFW